MESKIGSTLAYTGIGTIIGATIMKKIDNMYSETDKQAHQYKPNKKLIKSLQNDNLTGSTKKTELERDVYVTGSKFLKSSESDKSFYSYKKKEESVEDFIKSEPDFYTSDKLFSNLKTPNSDIGNNNKKILSDDVVKLIINNDSTLFIESDKSIGCAQNVSGIIVDPCKEFNFAQLDCGKIKS